MLDAHRVLDVVFISNSVMRGGLGVVDRKELRDRRAMTSTEIWVFVLYFSVLDHLLVHWYVHVIHAVDLSALAAWPSVPVDRARRTRVRFWTVGWHRPERRLKKLTRLALHRLVDDMLLHGRVGEDFGVSDGYRKSRVHAIRSSIDPPDLSYEPALALSHEQLGEILSSAVIQLNLVKRLVSLIGAAEYLRRAGLNEREVFVGDGLMEGGLRAQAEPQRAPLSLDGEAYDVDAIGELYKSLGITVAPVSAGLTVIQSTFCGVSVDSHDDVFRQVPEWETIRSALNWEVYPAGNVDTLTKSIACQLSACDAYANKAHRASINETGEDWSPESRVRKILEVLNGGNFSDCSGTSG